tara:strand:+ start:322 stop:627 length:306 start_codon:yes stop_codon:yes gene_type:complete
MIDIFTVMKLEEGKYYRVTEVNGKKWRGEFEKEFDFRGRTCIQFCFEHHVIDISLVEKIEEASWIDVQEQAKEKNCLDEYFKYQTINGKVPRTKFIYKELV